MRIIISNELAEYMRHRGKNTIAVEVATSDHSDIEVSEIFYRLCDEKHRKYLLEKRGFREIAAPEVAEATGPEVGATRQEEAAPEFHVLFPNYRMEKAEEITFDLQKRWLFHFVRGSGISL